MLPKNTQPFSPSLCGCCSSHHCTTCLPSLSRRTFIAGSATTLALNTLVTQAQLPKDPVRFTPERKALVVQPVLIYETPQHREGVSWRSWGSIQTDADAEHECQNIEAELEIMKQKLDFPVEIKAVEKVKNPDQAAQVAAGNHDAVLMYAAGAGVNTLEAVTNPNKWNLIFLRHRSGPAYLWYEIISNRYLRKTVDEFGQPGVDTLDVVVDDYDELIWRLRALTGLKNTQHKKIVCVGGASGWGEGGRKAPELTQKRFNMELIDVTYNDLKKRIVQAQNNSSLVKWSNEQAAQYLKQESIELYTDETFVKKCFLLTEVFYQLMHEAQTDAITINLCMGTIMQVAETTACLPLSLLNDEGYMAFCESDFVVIPSGILLHGISGMPVFLNDPTYPHAGLVTLAHCTAPRKMNGKEFEPAKILTHFESDWGAAPKVEMKLGQKITVIDPDFNFNQWMGFEAEIVDNPFFDICRSQIDVAFACDTDDLNRQTKGFHWMAGYGNYLKEMNYAVKKSGMNWQTLT